jgi:hypothetical protein
VRVAGHGLAVEVPAGWESRISRRARAGPVLHLATFPLIASDGDFGAAATGRMRGDDIFAALLEFASDPALRPGAGLFREIGRPAPMPGEFAPGQLQVTRAGQQGWQRFFASAGRAYCLYAVIRPLRRRRDQLVAELGSVLATLELPQG